MPLLIDGGTGLMSQGQFDVDIFGEAPDKMTYTEQAQKRTHCKRLAWCVDVYTSLDIYVWKHKISVICAA